ncbi:hypothetical protein [Robertkochia solimangrovi]|uniref:hypothetical protein n=1 Tax=Robertkochia solimangrovi TaxID=2213046 RepID=UPI001181368D|nr:hypothetical protein [Robertkochia solimangrovi]TRZ42529.1 hypothetical protein DMZ48_13590 [Robertkochia solimangrovi]
MVNIIALDRSELRTSLDNRTLWKSGKPPFSLERGYWLTDNPYADDADIIAILALENDRIVSQIEVIPAVVRTGKSTIEKKYWLRNWESFPISDKDSNADKMGSLIYFEAIKRLNGQILVGSYTKVTEKFYANERLFKKLRPRSIYTIFTRIPEELVMDRYSLPDFMKYPLRFANATALHLRDQYGKKVNKNRSSGIGFLPVAGFDDQNIGYIKNLMNDDFVVKDATYLNWLMDPRQYPEININASSKHQITAAFVTLDNHIKGFLCYVITGTTLSVKLALYEPENTEIIANALMLKYYQHKCTRLITTNDNLAGILATLNPIILAHKNEKSLVAYKDVHLEQHEFVLRDGDGR